MGYILSQELDLIKYQNFMEIEIYKNAPSVRKYILGILGL